MTRILATLSSAALLAAGALAQCPQGANANLVNWDYTAFYASAYGADDEGISPPIALTAFPNFPMAGAVGNLDQLWVNSNGELYLTDSTLALTQPVGGAAFGVDSLAEMRGNVAGGSARIVAIGGDHERSAVAGSDWSVTVDQSVPGEVQVTWVDMSRYVNTTDRFSFTARLFASGIVSFAYGTTFPTPYTGKYVGLSIGNLVGTTTSPNLDLSAGADSGVEGMLYQSFTGTAPNVFDLAGTTLTIIPNGTGGYTALPLGAYVPPTCATNVTYGAGCYAIAGSANSVHEVITGTPAMKAYLDGNSMTYTMVPQSGYLVTWNAGGGAGYLAPTGGATLLPATDDGNATITLGGPLSTPFGSVNAINVSTNGILTLAAAANNNGDFSPSVAELTSNTLAPNSGFYTWGDFISTTAGSGRVKAEQIGAILYITWDGVDDYGTPALTSSTWQYQIDTVSGSVTVVWSSMSASTDAADTWLVGASLAGAGTTPGAVTLSTGLPVSLLADRPSMTLSASARPVINPSTTMVYTVGNIPEYIAGSGIYIATMFLSLGSLPGVDLGFIGAPGCLAHIASLDVNLSVGPVPLFPTQTASFTYDNIGFAPGNVIYAQAIALFDPALQPAYSATGNTFGLLTSNAIQHNIQNQ